MSLWRMLDEEVGSVCNRRTVYGYIIEIFSEIHILGTNV